MACRHCTRRCRCHSRHCRHCRPVLESPTTTTCTGLFCCPHTLLSAVEPHPHRSAVCWLPKYNVPTARNIDYRPKVLSPKSATLPVVDSCRPFPDTIVRNYQPTSNTDWQVTDVALLANIHDIDSSLANSYNAHGIRGTPLHLHYTCVVASASLATDSSCDLNMAKGYIKLRQLYWAFIKNGVQKSTMTSRYLPIAMSRSQMAHTLGRSRSDQGSGQN